MAYRVTGEDSIIINGEDIKEALVYINRIIYEKGIDLNLEREFLEKCLKNLKEDEEILIRFN